MRAAVPLIALVLATSAAAEPSAPAPAPSIVVPAPNLQLTVPEDRVPCRDTIHAVREERGLPLLQRETVSSEEPLLIATVDHRINGCSVMVMRNNTSDIRPLPALPLGSGRLQRIPGG